MTQPPLSAIILSVLIGISACTPTAEQPAEQPAESTTGSNPAPSQTESTPETQTGNPQTPIAEGTSPERNSQSTLRPDNPDVPGNTETPATDEPIGSPDNDESCDETATQREMNVCAQQRYQQANKKLNLVYQDLQSNLPANGQQALSNAELAWIEFRDLNCTFAKNQFAGGSIAPLVYHNCLETHTTTRLAELKQPQLPRLSYQAADTQLNSTYQDLLAVLSEPEKEDITDIQLAWIEYRDRSCAFEILYGADVIEESQCLARMSETRTAQLAQDIEQRSL